MVFDVPVKRLVVVPDSDRVEQWLLDASRRADFVDLRGVATFSQLVDRCEPALFAKRNAADPTLVRFLFGHHARTHAAAFGGLATTPEFAAQVHELVAELRTNAAEPWHLAQAAAKVEGGLAARAKALSELWRVVDAALDAKGLVDRGEWTRLARQRLEAHGLPKSLRGYEVIEVRELHNVSPARLAFLEQFAKACEHAGVTFRWSWPAAGESNVDAFIIEAVRHAEATWAQLDLQLEREVTEAPLAWVGRELFAPEPQRKAAPELTAFVAPTARDEAREIARRVRRSVTHGVPAESIAVVFRDLAGDTELLVEALAELGVPARARLGVPLPLSVVGRLALSVLELADDGFPADAVAGVLESRLVGALHEEAAEPRRAFREAGIRDDALGGVEGEGAYTARLSALAKRSGESARSVELLAEGVARLLALSRELKDGAPALELLDAWWDALSKLGLLDGARASELSHGDGLLHRELVRAEARDQAAAGALAGLLSGLKSALRESGLGTQAMTRRAFARWVRGVAAEVNLVARGPRGGAVWLLEARELAGRRFAQVFVGGLLDGRFPGRPTPQALLSDDERGLLNRELGRTLFRTSVGEGDVRLPVRLAEDRLLFHFALSAGAAVTLSRARFDDAGRETLASPFLEAVARVVEGFEEVPVRRAPVASLDEVQTEQELRVRASLEALSPTVTRQTVVDPRGPALADALGEEPWFQAARASGAAETERLRFFSDETQDAGAFSGRLSGEVLALMEQRLAFDAQHPLSAHELQNWAQCAFRGLSMMVLGLEAPERAGEELDGRARGSFWHDALAEVVPVLNRAGLLGRASPDVKAYVEKAVKTAAARTAQRSAVGHPALWSLAQDWAVRIITRVVTSDTATPFGLARPEFVEVDFGTPKAPEALREVKVAAGGGDERDVFLRGRMDRVDTTPGTIGVVDYKSSVSKTITRDFLVREFQMAFYLLAAQQLDSQAAVTGLWLGLSRNESRKVIDNKLVDSARELLAMDELTRHRLADAGKPNLANAVHEVLSGLRRGDFGARSRPECGECELKPVCRISQRKLLDDVP